MRAIVSLFVLLASAAACGDDDAARPGDSGPSGDASIDAPAGDGGDADAGDAGGPRDWPLMEVSATTMAEPGIVRELVRVPGATPPPNPTTLDETPRELNATTVLRYRPAGDSPSARAILVAMPGTIAGGASYDALARALVRRGMRSGETVEVWALDRRSNTLEDLRGMDTAEAAGNAEIAQGYYFGGDTVGGVAFDGVRTQSELSFVSEWGLATHVEDTHRVIALVPEADRRGHVFLLGHSLGATFANAYAAWRFEDGTRGSDELAGIVLIDGGSGEAVPPSETELHEGLTSAIIPLPGLDAVRSGQPYLELPFVGTAAYLRFEIQAMRALFAGAEVTEDPGRDRLLSTLLATPPADVPAMTNRAALGLVFDDGSSLITITAASIGEPTGGAIEEYASFLDATRTLVRPSDPTATYDWRDASELDPPEHTPLDNLAHALVDGRTNFVEWYFPLRLTLDLQAAGAGDLAEDSWQTELGIRTFDVALVDAPILAIAAGITTVASYEPVRARVGSIGAGRPHAGETRDRDTAFRVLDATTMTHLDPVTAADSGANEVPAAIEAFVTEHVAPGSVTVGTGST